MARKFDTFNTTWKNFHNTVNESVNQVQVIANDNGVDFYTAYTDTKNYISKMLSDAIDNNRNIRICGGRWSFTPLSLSKDLIIDPTNISRQSRLYPSELDPACSILPENLIICQGGAKIKTISNKLYQWGKSLYTSGASNGQTITGAISTGTHGSNISFGSTQEMVVGIHIILDKDRSFLIEKQSEPISNKSFQDKIGADLIRDDELFNAALVSLGSFGFLYGVILKVTDLFVLRNYVKKISLSQIESVIDNNLQIDKSNYTIPQETGNNPEHIKFLIDPYSKKCKAEIMYRKDFYTGYKSPIKPDGSHYNPDLLKIIGSITQGNPLSTPTFINLLSGSIFPKDVNGEDGILAHHFYDTTTAGNTFSTAMGIPLNKAKEALNLLIQMINTNQPIPAILSLRFVKGSNALMGFTKFDNTCILEIDGVRNAIIENFIKKIPSSFTQQGIPFTFHWGKDNPLNKTLISSIYGTNFDKWKINRKKIMDMKHIDLFCTPYAYALGICDDGGTLDVDPIIT